MELKLVHSQVLQQQSRKIKNIFYSFLRGLKSGKKVGYPRFKSLTRFHSLTFPQSGFSIKNNKLFVSKVGLISVRMYREIKGEILTMTIKRAQSGKWFACFICKFEINSSPNQKRKRVGIDLGLAHFATFSDGSQIENPKFLNKTETKINFFQSQLSKKRYGS